MDYDGINLLLAQIKQAHFAASKLSDSEFSSTYEVKSLARNSLIFSLAEIGAGIANVPGEVKSRYPKVKWEFFESMHKNAALEKDISLSPQFAELTKWINGELSPALESLRKYLLSALLD